MFFKTFTIMIILSSNLFSMGADSKEQMCLISGNPSRVDNSVRPQDRRLRSQFIPKQLIKGVLNRLPKEKKQELRRSGLWLD